MLLKVTLIFLKRYKIFNIYRIFLFTRWYMILLNTHQLCCLQSHGRISSSRKKLYGLRISAQRNGLKKRTERSTNFLFVFVLVLFLVSCSCSCFLLTFKLIFCFLFSLLFQLKFHLSSSFLQFLFLAFLFCVGFSPLSMNKDSMAQYREEGKFVSI